MEKRKHWESIYGKRDHSEQGWFTSVPEPSLSWIRSLGLSESDSILDAGGGASTLVDHLLENGFARVTVADLSAAALTQARERLGERASEATWHQGDILRFDPPAESFAVWHDRAVFHFLHDEEERSLYRRRVLGAVQPGGWLILGSFRSGAPDTCSGLPVRHHSADELEDFFSAGFDLAKEHETVHITPGGVEQAYVFVCLQRHLAGREM
jgi:SAM-dependent methyltransferase